MSYSERFNLTLTYSPEISRIAANIGRGFDPDSGGAYSFAPDIIGWNGDTPIYGNTLSTSTPCTPEFKAQGEYLMTSPDALFMAMQAAYAERWADLTAPTLEECQAFCAAIILEPQI